MAGLSDRLGKFSHLRALSLKMVSQSHHGSLEVSTFLKPSVLLLSRAVNKVLLYSELVASMCCLKSGKGKTRDFFPSVEAFHQEDFVL